MLGTNIMMDDFISFFQNSYEAISNLPWWGQILAYAGVAFATSRVYAFAHNTVKAGIKAGKVTYGIAKIPFNLASKAYHRFVPENINTKYSGKGLSIPDIIYLNRYFARHGTGKVDSDILHAFAEASLRLKDARGKPVIVRELERFYGNKDSKKFAELTRVTLELDARNDNRAEKIRQKYVETKKEA